MSILKQGTYDIDPLSAYQTPRCFFFRSPRYALLARGVLGTLPSCNARDPGTMLTRVRSTLDQVADHHPQPVLVGAIPFRSDVPARLILPAEVRWTRSGTVPQATGMIAPSFSKVRPIPDADAYKRATAAVLRELRDGRLKKVMLARSMQLSGVRGVDARTLLRLLAHNHPDSYVFAVDLLAGRVLIGASPELLVRRSGMSVSARPLTGSAPRHADPVADAESGDSLLSSREDLLEHTAVIDAVADGLRPYCEELTVPDEPTLVKTPTSWRLGTPITGRLVSPEISSLQLVMALHPVPSICGSPAAEAGAMIERFESLNRGFYGGAVGWCDTSGDGEWAITTRCVELAPSEIRLYTAAEVVPASTPEGELAETSARFQIMLSDLGIDQSL